MTQASAPPRHPRALFIAAFALAGAVFERPRAPPIAYATPYRIGRRDRSIAHIAKGIGMAIVAGGRAADAFHKRGALYAPPEPPKPKLDPIALALMESREVALAIGRPSPVQCDDAAWIDIHRDAAVPHIKIYWRGEFIQGERMGRLLKDDPKTGRQWIEQAQGETVGSARSLSMDRFGEGVEAAKSALRKAGIRLSTFTEIKRVNTPAFKGAIATIGLARAVSNVVPLRRLGMAR